MTDFSIDDVTEAVANRLKMDSRDAWPGVLRPDVAARYLGISKVRLYQIINSDPNFPRQIRYTNRCVGFLRESVNEWLRAKEGAA